jgi:hypothetical protein
LRQLLIVIVIDIISRHMNIPTPDAPDTSPQRQRQIYLQLIHELLGMLAPPVDPGPDRRAALDRRIKTATALVSAMLPATAEEADLAVRAVAASACLRLPAPGGAAGGGCDAVFGEVMRGWGVGDQRWCGLWRRQGRLNADERRQQGMNADVPEQPVLPCVDLDARASPWHAASVFIPADRRSSVLSLACLPASRLDRFLGGPLASGGDFLTGGDMR